MSKMITCVKEWCDYLLVSERINSQTCTYKELDTTKTIIDHH